jgi:Fe-S cluster assembly scaffold protein SufB
MRLKQFVADELASALLHSDPTTSHIYRNAKLRSTLIWRWQEGMDSYVWVLLEQSVGTTGDDMTWEVMDR